MIKTPIKRHGGKYYLAPKLVPLIPEHDFYIEPYAGGLSLLLAKEPSPAEIINDLDRNLTNFWQVIADPQLFVAFQEGVIKRPVCEQLFVEALYRLHHSTGLEQPVPKALDFFVVARQSLSGRMKTFAPASMRLRRGMLEQISAWWGSIEGLADVHERMSNVLIYNQPAINIIKRYSAEAKAFWYIDPPYYPEERASKAVYDHEMTHDQHSELLDLITSDNMRGKVMISGYDSKLYSVRLKDWNRCEFDLANHASGDDAKRRMLEVVWMNY